MHTQQVLGLKCLCTEERGKEVSEACPKGTVRPILWQITDFTRKFLEAINRKWLSKSRWSMLTAGTTQEIAERLNGCKKNALLLRPWQSQYIHSSSSSSFTALISPSYKVSQSANTFCLCNLLSLNQQGRAGTFCLGGNGQEGFTSCAKDDSETPSNNHCLSGALAICANSRQLQMCVFPTSICRDLALETGICLPTYCLWVHSVPRVKFPMPHSSLAVLPDMLQDGGQTYWVSSELWGS
ncbi:uncharacterized protein LOC130604998 isoform X2 [Pezoporus wallicus]|uniref:uncharacterized protein LOC130604998 isoform X2 n=1 Tax=Pezoporus wallicus TaxID=35540 RepID=UPI00255095A3|nr:uncharacterized protein LOC130604998 isoform X2 [Pezoporus wallicus]